MRVLVAIVVVVGDGKEEGCKVRFGWCAQARLRFFRRG
jgi:hypothetical protein